MRLRAEIALFCIISVVWIQHTLCDGNSTNPKTNKWSCTCSIAPQGNLNFILQNCSSSCHCTPAAGGPSDENKLTCICDANKLPKVAGEDNGDGCFTECDCNAGDLLDKQASEKWILNKLFVIVFLICVGLIALAFIASTVWYLSRKCEDPIQRPIFSSDGRSSGSNGSRWIIQEASSVGCIPTKSFLFRSKTGDLHGSMIRFAYSELESATNRFSEDNLIGLGGSSRVYLGHLRDGRTVAIKRMKTQGGADAEHVFLTEIELIFRLHHCHVVPLLGYCSEHQGKRAERLLVFEYIPNGNLRECLDEDSENFLEWNTRVSIALGAARGLEYLHDAAAPRILHRDVKSTNILLDENWTAKITDLGMAKHLDNDGTVSCSSSPARMQGTFGYFAPEYAIVGRASLKSDVFSFGVVLLELITGRKPIHKSLDKGEESLVIWATPRLLDSKRVVMELPDSRLNGNFQEEELQVMAYLARECLLLDPDSRPTMREVVQILSTIANEKSRRKDFPVFKHSSNSVMTNDNPDLSDDEFFYTSVDEEIKQITSERPSSDPCSNLCAVKSEKETKIPSNDIEKLMLLTTKSRSWRYQDDEIVDLTEPRFESFCLSKIDSHVIEI